MEYREDGHVLECGGVLPLLPRSAIPKSSEVYREAVLKLRRPLANPPGHLIYSDPLSKSAAVGHWRRRSGRNRELAGKRWCDPTLAVRRVDHAANPNRVRPGTLQQQRSPSSHQVFGDRHQPESQLRRRSVHPDSCHARRPVSVSRRHSKHRESVVVSEAFLKKRSGIPAIGPQCFPIDQQRQHAIWENAVVIKPKLLRLDDRLFLSHWESTHKFHGNIERAENSGRI